MRLHRKEPHCLLLYVFFRSDGSWYRRYVPCATTWGTFSEVAHGDAVTAGSLREMAAAAGVAGMCVVGRRL